LGQTWSEAEPEKIKFDSTAEGERHRQPADDDSGQHGKGGVVPDVPLSPALLDILREHWRWMRPKTYLFPGTPSQNSGSLHSALGCRADAMTLNPEIFTWARTAAGLSAEEAARALGFNNTRERSATERLKALETGDEEPSRSVLRKMAKAYRRSLLVFYLPAPPRTGDRGSDFRTVPGAPPPLYNPILDTLIRDVRGRQAIVRSLFEETEPQPVDFVGAATMDIPPNDLAARIVGRLQFSLADFRRQATVEQAFSYLRDEIEAAGVFVLLLGNLGSHHTNVPVDIFRGFAIADPIAPFIVINDQDARPAWSFTALHELAHIWLGTTGISGTSIEARIERYCNDVAGEILLPAAELHDLGNLRRGALDTIIETVSGFASARKISRAMVSYKLLRLEMIAEPTWRQLAERFRQEWLASRRREEDDGSGGPSYYVVKRHRLGNALLDTVRRSLAEGILTPTKAAQVLGVKARNVDPLLHGTLVEQGRR
jgi:Zn-dependent peptidase ImmA (M78 family)